MSEERFVFEYQELVEMMLRRKGIKEGRWILSVEFGIGAVNVRQPGVEVSQPAAIVPVKSIGIIRNDKAELDNLVVDAAKLGDGKASRKRSKENKV